MEELNLSGSLPTLNLSEVTPPKEGFLDRYKREYIAPFTQPYPSPPTPDTLSDVAYNSIVRPLMGYGRTMGTLFGTMASFPASGIAGLADLLVRQDLKKAGTTIESVMSTPAQAFMGAPPILGQEFPVYDFSQGVDNLTPEQRTINLVASPFSELHRLNEAISGNEGQPSALRHIAGAIPETLAYTIGARGVARAAGVPLKAIEMPARARIFAKRQAAAEKAGIPQTATTGEPVQPTIKPNIPTVAPVPDTSQQKLDLGGAENILPMKIESTEGPIIVENVKNGQLELDLSGKVAQAEQPITPLRDNITEGLLQNKEVIDNGLQEKGKEKEGQVTPIEAEVTDLATKLKNARELLAIEEDKPTPDPATVDRLIEEVKSLDAQHEEATKEMSQVVPSKPFSETQTPATIGADAEAFLLRNGYSEAQIKQYKKAGTLDSEAANKKASNNAILTRIFTAGDKNKAEAATLREERLKKLEDSLVDEDRPKRPATDEDIPALEQSAKDMERESELFNKLVEDELTPAEQAELDALRLKNSGLMESDIDTGVTIGELLDKEASTEDLNAKLALGKEISARIDKLHIDTQTLSEVNRRTKMDAWKTAGKEISKATALDEKAQMDIATAIDEATDASSKVQAVDEAIKKGTVDWRESVSEELSGGLDEFYSNPLFNPELYKKTINLAVRLVKESPTYNNLVRLGKSLYTSGVKNFGDFRAAFKDAVGGMWDRVGSQVRSIWNEVVKWNHNTNILEMDISSDKKYKSLNLDFLGMQSMYEAIQRKLIVMKAVKDAEKQYQADIAVQNRAKISGEPIPSGTLLIAKGEKLPIFTEGRMSKKGMQAQEAYFFMKRALPELYTFRNTAAERHAFNILMADSAANTRTSTNSSSITHIVKGLSKAERENIRGVLEGKEPALNAHVQIASDKLKTWLDTMRTRYKAFSLDMYKKELSPNEYNALMDEMSGKFDHAETVKKYGVDSDLLLEMKADINKIEKWGLDDYVPNVELGTLLITDSKGTVRAVAVSRMDAARKALDVHQKNPEVGQLFLETNTNRDPGMALGISTKAYFTMMGRLAKGIEKRVEGINSEMAREIAKRGMKGNFTLQPTDTFSEFAKRRRDVLIGEKDIIPVLHKYSRQMEKKMSLDPAISEFRKEIPNLNPTLVKELNGMIDAAKGKYGSTDKAVDTLLNGIKEEMRRGLGIDTTPSSFALTRGLAGVRTGVSYAMFGYRPIAGIVNGLSGGLKTWYKTSADYMIKERAFHNSPEGQAILKEMYDYLGTSITFAETGQPHARVSLLHPLGIFQFPEVPIRSHGALTNYLWARDQLKLGTKEECIEYALRQNAFQQCMYNLAALPSYMRGPIGKTVTQFKPYLIHEIPFIQSLHGIEYAKYAIGTMALAGPKGIHLVLKSLPFFVAAGAITGLDWDKALEWVNANNPRLSRGVPGLVGADMTAAATFQLPTETPWDMAGVFITKMKDLTTLLTDQVSGVHVEPRDYGKWGLSWSPEAAKIWKTTEAIIDYQGAVKDSKGATIYNMWEGSDSEFIKDLKKAHYITLSVLGIRPLTEGIYADIQEKKYQTNEIRSANVSRMYSRMYREIRTGGNISSQSIKDIEEYHMDIPTFIEKYKKNEIPANIRNVVDAKLQEKVDMINAYPSQEDISPVYGVGSEPPPIPPIPQSGPTGIEAYNWLHPRR